MQLEPLNPQTATDAEAYAWEAARTMTTIAKRLRILADRLDEATEIVKRGDGKTVRHTASMMNEFIQTTGGLGTYWDSVIDSAGKADRHAFAAPLLKMAEDWKDYEDEVISSYYLSSELRSAIKKGLANR